MTLPKGDRTYIIVQRLEELEEDLAIVRNYQSAVKNFATATAFRNLKTILQSSIDTLTEELYVAKQ